MWLASHTEPHCSSLGYDRLLTCYAVRPLRARRVQADVMFLTKLFRGFISSSYLLQCFSLHVPARDTRVATSTLFTVPRGRVNVIQSSLPVRVPRTVNDFIASRPSVDIFHDPIGKLKKEIASFTSTLDIFI